METIVNLETRNGGNAQTIVHRFPVSLVSLFILFVVFASVLRLDAQSSMQRLFGKWDLTVTTPDGEVPSWMEVSKAQGQISILMVGASDHATPLRKVEVSGNAIEFGLPTEDDGFPADLLFKGTLIGKELSGIATDSAGDSWPWKGVQAPTLKRKTSLIWGKPTNLFNGTDLTGWTPRNPGKPGTWKVEDHTLITRGPGSDLITTTKYTDFKLHVEFNVASSSNSGVYLRGRYEVQIETDSVAEPNSHHTGGVYGFLDPIPEQPRSPDKDQTFDITLVGRTLTVVHNGVMVIENREIPGITGGALDSHEERPGPILLQGGEKGRVTFRKIVITPLRR